MDNEQLTLDIGKPIFDYDKPTLDNRNQQLEEEEKIFKKVIPTFYTGQTIMDKGNVILVKSKSTGIIATHDLSLCEVANEHPAVKNHYFDAEIIDNELHFDYTFKDGICQNMNAS